jgi:HPt (histidine-containing phosphotransfer) domain-containing protein
MELFNEWKQELEAELKKLVQELETAEANAEAAAQAAKVARAKRAAVSECFARLHPNASVAGVLDVRRHAVADDYQRLEGAATSQRLHVQNLQHRIRDLQDGIDQLVIITPPAKPEHDVLEGLVTFA